MTVRAGNLFGDVSAARAGEEAFREIFSRPGLKIERIVSRGQASPPELVRSGVERVGDRAQGQRHIAVRRRAFHAGAGRRGLRLHPRKETAPRRVDGPATANGLARVPFRVRACRDWINARHSGLNIHGICTPIR